MLFEEFVGERHVAPGLRRRFRQFLVQREEVRAARLLTGQEIDRYWCAFFCTQLTPKEQSQTISDFNDGMAKVYQELFVASNEQMRFLAIRGVVFIRWSVLPWGQAAVSWN
jgi:hypothetical protein